MEPQTAVAGLEGDQVPRPAEPDRDDSHLLAVAEDRGHAASPHGDLHRTFASQVADGLEELGTQRLGHLPCSIAVWCAGGCQVNAKRSDLSAWPQR